MRRWAADNYRAQCRFGLTVRGTIDAIIATSYIESHVALCTIAIST